MWYVGIDPSFSGTAVVVVDTTSEVVAQYLISTPPVETWVDQVERIVKMQVQLHDALWGNSLRPVKSLIVCMEGYSHGSGNRAHMMGELGHAYRATLVHCMTTYPQKFVACLIPPTTLKKFVVGKGNCGKIAVVASLSAKYGNLFEGDDNKWDAFGLALLARALHFATRSDKIEHDYTGGQMKIATGIACQEKMK